MLARTLLLRIQRALYQRLQKVARDSLGGLSPALRNYYLEYRREFSRFQKISNNSELLNDLFGSDIAICGDYHTLAQAQRTVIRLLRDVLPKMQQFQRPVVLALEAFRPSDNAAIRSYLKGTLSERGFLKKVDFERRWGFPWESYREIFEFARETRIGIEGINPRRRNDRPVRQRDTAVAKSLAKIHSRSPKTFVFCLIGDLHLATKHLPSALSATTQARVIRILQNVDSFYWKLAHKELEHFVDVVKVKDCVYCILNTPPWVKLQSHLKWLDVIGQTPIANATHPSVTMKKALSEMDQADEMHDLIGTLGKFFGVVDRRMDDFSVYGPHDIDFLKRLQRNERWSQNELKQVSSHLAAFRSYFIPRENIFYFSNLSLNHSAAQAAIYVHAKLSEFDRVFEEPRRDFFCFVWVEALSFLGSKVINHKRKSKSLEELQFLASGALPVTQASRETVTIARSAVALFHAIEKGTVRSWFRAPLGKPVAAREANLFFYKTSKVVGRLLGEAIYQGLVSEKVSSEEVRKLFLINHANYSTEQNRRWYQVWARRLDLFDSLSAG